MGWFGTSKPPRKERKKKGWTYGGRGNMEAVWNMDQPARKKKAVSTRKKKR